MTTYLSDMLIFRQPNLPMEAPPKLSFACPLPWKNMSGDERLRFCSGCGHHISNISLLSHEERVALLERAKATQVCGSYYVRLSGELVTQDNPLSERERGKVRQFGVTALSAAAFAIAAGCVSPGPKTQNLHPIPATAGIQPEKNPEAKKAEPNESAKADDEIVLLTGFIVCRPPPSAKVHGPHSK